MGAYREIGYGVCFFVSALAGAFAGPFVLLWPIEQAIGLPQDPTISGTLMLTAIAIGTMSGSAAW